MLSPDQPTVRVRLRVVITIGTALTAAVATLAAVPAQAALTPGTGWTAVTLPANYAVANGSDGPPLSPVSCVTGSEFCVAVAADTKVSGPNGTIGQGDLVTSDGGRTWQHYEGLPSASMLVTAISCPSTSVCWVSGPGPRDQPEVAESVDAGQTWTLRTPAAWAGAGWSWWPNSIDCVSASICWLAGMTASSIQSPAVAETTDGGATWTRFSNLPTFPPYDQNGTYLLNGISCTSALACVAVGGLNEADGVAVVISTTDGGATWSMSADPTLRGVQQLFSVSCLPGSNALPTCNAAADALQAAGPVEVTSADGGATWTGMETYDNTGWLNSISCADALHCWAAGSGTSVALVGTATGGASWSAQTAETANEDGSVSCATVTFCVATNDNALLVTSDDGGLTAAATTRPLTLPAGTGAADGGAAVIKPVSRSLPHLSGSDVWQRDGHSLTVTGKYRGTAAASTAAALIVLPNGTKIRQSARIGLNNFYSITISSVVQGTTSVTFTAGNDKKVVVRVHGHPGPAPVVTALSAHAGPVAGGGTVTITGANFTKVTRVMFGPWAGSHVVVKSATRLTVQAPAGTGARYVTVVTSGGGPSPLTGRGVYNFLPLPVITGLSPTTGPAGGGTRVTITGTGLAFVKAVYFGAHVASHVVVLSARKITVVAPAGTGTVNVRVLTAGGITALTGADRFTY